MVHRSEKRDLIGAALLVSTVGVGWLASGGRTPLPQGQQPAHQVENSLGMTFRFLPDGTFEMGSLTGQPDERPPHRVTLSPFYMAVHETTQAAYEAVMGENPSRFQGPALPVESVGWAEASDFCARLSEREGAAYRLPTEAEWEYAARGGMEGAEFLWGESALPSIDGVPQANVADESFRAQFPRAAEESGYVAGYDDGYPTTAPVGSFPANGFGLFDMIGNVFEWCSDRYVLGTQYYLESPEVNPRGPASGEDRVLRGASWWAAPARFFRVASRFRDSPDAGAPAIGFRCVMDIPAKEDGPSPATAWKKRRPIHNS